MKLSESAHALGDEAAAGRHGRRFPFEHLAITGRISASVTAYAVAVRPGSMAKAIPMISPFRFTTAPPESPGASAAARTYT